MVDNLGISTEKENWEIPLAKICGNFYTTIFDGWINKECVKQFFKWI